MAIGRLVDRFIKAGSDGALAGGAMHQTTLAEALPTGATGPNFGAILFATGTAQGACITDIRCLSRLHLYLIKAQMAATLTDTTVAAQFLTGMADFIPTDWAKAAVIGTGARSTSPTETATGVTIRLSTNRTGRDSTGGAKNLLTSPTLMQTVVTDDMPIAIQHNLRHFVVTNIAPWALKCAIIAVA